MSLNQDILDQIAKELNAAFTPQQVNLKTLEQIQDKKLKTLALFLAGVKTPGGIIAALLDIQVTSFAYGDIKNVSNTSQQLGAALSWSNSTTVEESFQQEFSQTSTASFTWSVSEGLQVGASAKYSAGLPDALGSQVTVSVQLSFQATQSQTTTTSQNWQVNATINVPPLSCVGATMNLAQEQFDVPWSATCTIAQSAKLSQSDFDLLIAGLYDGKTLSQVLPGSLMNQQVTGTMTGNYGTATTIVTTQTAAPPDAAETTAGSQLIAALGEVLGSNA